jgi:hypothetical protein
MSDGSVNGQSRSVAGLMHGGWIGFLGLEAHGFTADLMAECFYDLAW